MSDSSWSPRTPIRQTVRFLTKLGNHGVGIFVRVNKLPVGDTGEACKLCYQGGGEVSARLVKNRDCDRRHKDEIKQGQYHVGEDWR